MDFLKALFADGPLTFDQLKEKAEAAKLKIVDLSQGGYISQDKHNDKVKQLTDQVEALTGQMSQRDTDMADLQAKLTAAQADASKLSEVQTTLTDLQGRYTTEKQDLEGKLAQQAYEFAVRERAGALQFSSTAAQKAFIQEAINMGFKLDGDTLLGYEDFVTKYKADDPGAFAPETTEPEGGAEGEKTPPPQIVAPTTGAPAAPEGGFHFNFSGVRPKPQE